MRITGCFVCLVWLVAVAQTNQRELGKKGENDDDLAQIERIEACYESLPTKIEVPTSREWWNAPVPLRCEQTSSLFRRRLAFEPLQDSDTVVAGVLFSLSGGTLKLSAIFPPLYPEEQKVANLIVKRKGKRVATDECIIKPNIWYCSFRVDKLGRAEDVEDDYSYEVVYQPNAKDSDLVYTYGGKIPLPKENPRIAALGCFGYDGHNTEKKSLIDAVQSQGPDLLLLQGDQTYVHDHLGFGFLHLIYSIQELTRSTPTIVQMDDHDYGSGNLWGAGYTEDEESGSGFEKPVCLINALQELCMGHNPDPATSDTLQNGITIHYGNYEYGRLDFAVLEARKFKNRKWGDSLLGDAQEEWLKEWCSNSGDRVKIVLTQTPFAALGTHVTSPKGEVAEVINPPDDPNGFPVAGRTRAMEILKGCTNLVLSGDQHLAIVVSYDDYKITECASPAALNSVFWRLNRKEIGSSQTDLHGNQYTLHEVWNVGQQVITRFGRPGLTIGASEEVKDKRGDGFLMVEIDGKEASCSALSYRTLVSSIWNHTTFLQGM